MFCKSYSVLVIFCLTCLFLLTQLDSQYQSQFFNKLKYYQENSNSSLNNTNNNDSFVAVTQLSDEITSKSYYLKSQQPPVEKRLILTNERYSKKIIQMENNNGHVAKMSNNSSPEKKPLSDPASPTIEHVATENQDNFSGNFNIKMLNDHLKKCIRESDQEVDMDEYISTFQQLYKFFCMLGTLFGFIGSDVRTKIEILHGYRQGENRSHYETVEKMIEFEKSTDYIHSNKESSGSRTFLRLHRSLIFVSKFLGKMETIGDSDGISKLCKEAYAQTLAKFHPWLIQKGAGIAMLGLPSKKDLIAKVCANGVVENDEVTPIMHDVIKLTNEIYDQCESLYTEHDLHGLP